MTSLLRSRAVPVLLAATVLVGGANLASYAANGKPLLLGTTNSASKTTTITTTGSGPALKLKSKAGSPPLAVTSSTKVAKLNADKVDGLEGAALQSKVFSYTVLPTDAVTGFSKTIAQLPKGRYVVSYSIVGLVSNVNSDLSCHLRLGTGPFEVSSSGRSIDGFLDGVIVSGSGYLDTRGPGAVTIACDISNGNVAVVQSDATRSQVTFTRVDDAVLATIP